MAKESGLAILDILSPEDSSINSSSQLLLKLHISTLRFFNGVELLADNGEDLRSDRDWLSRDWFPRKC